MQHTKASRPQDVGSALRHGSCPHETAKTDEEDALASYSQSLSKNGMMFAVPKNEEEDTKNKSAIPGCRVIFLRPEASTIGEFWKRTQNDRNAVASHIKNLVSKDGSANAKATLVAKQDRFDQLRIWCDEKLQQLEKRKGAKSGSARTLFPQYYSQAEEDAWLRKTFSAWLNADEEGRSNKPVLARANTKYPTPLTQLANQYDDEDQDDEEMIPIKPELEDDDDERMVSTYDFTPPAHPPPRKAARIANASGNMREPSTPDSDKAYYAQQQANHAIKRKREAAASRVKQKDEEDDDSDSEDDISTRQPPKKYVAVGLNGHFNGAKVTPQDLECKPPDGKVVKVVKRAWIWNENGRMVVYPPF